MWHQNVFSVRMITFYFKLTGPVLMSIVYIEQTGNSYTVRPWVLVARKMLAVRTQVGLWNQ